MEEYAREPCPWRIVDDCGGAFTMGAIGGGVFQAVKGFRNAPAVRLFLVVLKVVLLYGEGSSPQLTVV
uniref:Translocase of inner mitochondrial membrane 17 homolog B (yeast) n=1 Tax=Lates calcarifer TaxID=8187 RepID=A0A4W6DVB1_LATCA